MRHIFETEGDKRAAIADSSLTRAPVTAGNGMGFCDGAAFIQAGRSPAETEPKRPCVFCTIRQISLKSDCTRAAGLSAALPMLLAAESK